MSASTDTTAPPRARAIAALQSARLRTLALTAFEEAELTRQHSPLMSPLVWDLAHIGQQEEFFLLQRLRWQRPAAEAVFRPEVAALYDAFTHPRASRIGLPLLDAQDARRHLKQVRDRVLEQLSGTDPVAEDPGGSGGPFVAALVAQHELQHIETILATHQLRSGPALLTGESLPSGREIRGGRADSVLIPAGPVLIGAGPEVAEALDNERAQHTIALAAFRIGRVPVTIAEWLEFMASGGYTDPRWWSAQGWEHRSRAEIVAPLFWSRDGSGGWVRRRFGVTEAVPPEEPVQHVDFHEAQAFARWAGARLPTEFEWEKAAQGVRGPANLGTGALRPAPVGAYPQGASSYGVQQLLGDVWEWTSSPFAAYPGFRPMIYDTYSAPFFGPDYQVLRGGSWATDSFAVRPTFRNWDLPIRRQIFSGLRLAWDV